MIRCPKPGEPRPGDWVPKPPKGKGGIVETIIKILTGGKGK